MFLLLALKDSGPESSRWRDYLPRMESVRWDPAALDPELAFGLTAGPIEGMRLARDGGGGLIYAAERSEDTKLMILGLPSPLASAIPDEEECARTVLKAAGPDLPLSEPSPFAVDGRIGCELDILRSGGMAGYAAVVTAPGGRGVVVAMGDAPAAERATWRPRFAEAMRALRPTR